MDADDIIQPTHLQLYADNADCDIVFQGWTLFKDKTGEVIEVHNTLSMIARTKEEICEAICRLEPKSMTFGATWSKVFRRNIIEKQYIRFKEDISTAEDRIYTAEYLDHIKSMRVLPDATYWYRRSLSSAVGNYHQPDNVYRQMCYYRQAFFHLLQMPKVGLLVEEDYAHLCAHLCHMLYYPWHLTLNTRKRHKYLKIVLNQQKAHPCDELRYWCRDSVKATDNAQLRRYAIACARSTYHSLCNWLQR